MSRKTVIGFLTWMMAIATSASSWATPAQILIIRHGEKPEEGSHLSPRGYRRARALVAYFQHDPAVTRFGTPVAIYAMGQSSADSGLRPIETVTPLAHALGLPVLSPYEKDDTTELVHAVLNNPAYAGKMVLICWEHKKITPMVSEFGVSPEQSWPDSSFDQVWEIDFNNDKVSDFRIFKQNVDVGTDLDSPPLGSPVPVTNP